MGLIPPQLASVPGLSFGKMLGSGAGNGFSIWPDFGRYGLLQVWDARSYADHFFEKSDIFRTLRSGASSYWTIFLRTAIVHGKWDGECPFKPSLDYLEESPVAVLTRATIEPKLLWRFWRFVPPVSRSMGAHQEGLLFAKGVGELPLVQQATFSIWQNSGLMKAYAYQNARHREVVRKTRELGWYKEELFARFHPIGIDGTGAEFERLELALGMNREKEG